MTVSCFVFISCELVDQSFSVVLSYFNTANPLSISLGSPSLRTKATIHEITLKDTKVCVKTPSVFLACRAGVGIKPGAQTPGTIGFGSECALAGERARKQEAVARYHQHRAQVFLLP